MDRKGSMTPAHPVRATPLQPWKKAIIIGASSGIGAALARQLAREGYHLGLLARRTDRLDELCAQINTDAGQPLAHAYQHDVNETTDVPVLLQKVVSDLGGLDLFIYNTGMLLPGGARHFDFQKDLQMTAVNYIGALAWLNPVALLFQSARAGSIVGISSVAGERGRIGSPSYGASKAALTSYLESLRNRLTRLGVHVLTVKPGYVETALTQGHKKMFWLVTAEKAAEDICKAIRNHRQVIYVPARWRLMMFIVRSIPSFIFRKLSF